MFFPLLPAPDSCPVCGTSTALAALDVYDNTTRVVTSHERLGLFGCARCGLVFTHPQPTEAELRAYYGMADGWESRVGQSRKLDTEGELRRKLTIKRDRYERERVLLAPHVRSKPGRVLDFGCGLGGWLDVLQDDGWETWGIEPGPQQRRIAGERHHMIDAPPEDETFDLIVINHVVEHLRDPGPTMRALAAAAVPGGQLFVSVPDLGRLGEHGKWRYVKSEHHICSYTAAAMTSLLGLAGFRVVAHFDTPEWDALAENERWRLKLLAEKTGEVVEPSGEPLTEAIHALEAYARNAERFAEQPRSRPLAAAVRRRLRRRG
jgi:2-polyprenyl-3-methyl-5-hydroxy-6-metoxy-1,4-benzoquinol methylase